MLLSNDLLFLIPESTLFANAKGGFERKVILLVKEEETPHFDFLAKVLLSARLDLAKDALLCTIPAGATQRIAADLKEQQPGHVLVFGLPVAQLGLTLDIPMYQPTLFYESIWLIADPLSVLEPDKAKKSQLWTALKQIFL